MEETILFRKIKTNIFNNSSSSTKLQITLNSQPIDASHVTTKAYVDSLFENKRNRRYLSTVIND